LTAAVYGLERLPCNACGQVFTAQEPAEAGPDKYDETTGAMIAQLKYGSGVPFYRLEKPQASLAIPLPAATQWEIVKEAAEIIKPAARRSPECLLRPRSVLKKGEEWQSVTQWHDCVLFSEKRPSLPASRVSLSAHRCSSRRAAEPQISEGGRQREDRLARCPVITTFGGHPCLICWL
jgi:hypothetical protein